MGLYQYIREQEHRNDLIGELGRWMTKHYNERPDHDSLAFQLASKEFAACSWTRQEAIKRLNENKKFQAIVKIEPRISAVISEILKIRSNKFYNWGEEYYRFKTKISGLVGWKAERDELRNSDSYEVVLNVVVDLLPPSISDLYPNGLDDAEYERLQLDL